MDRIEAKILLKNLLSRIKPVDAGQFELAGILTDGEVGALNYLYEQVSLPQLASVGSLSAGVTIALSEPQEVVLPSQEAASDFAQAILVVEPCVELNLEIFDLPNAPTTARLCMDFGTAMSKATLVINDEDSDDYEEIVVLELGLPGDQQEVSDTMLISSVFIDGSGFLWFGKNAVDRSLIEGAEGERLRIDNVKRYLSEDAMHSVASEKFNPTDIVMNFGDLLLAYLMFMTWTVNACISDQGLPRNLNRRFAMPCFSQDKGLEVARKLRVLLGEAQILADTFGDRLHTGLPLHEFAQALKLLRMEQLSYPFVTENLTEPLGVANALLREDATTNSVTLIVDVGAGTSDMSLYRLHLDPEKNTRQAVEVEGSSLGIQQAGNYLDKALIELILKKAGVTSDHSRSTNIRGALELRIRDYKEALFNDEMVFITLLDGTQVEVELDEFKQLGAVQQFSRNLEDCLIKVLNNIDKSWLGVAANKQLAVVLTGGGAQLPMVQALAKGPLEIKEYSINRVHAPDFPAWLAEEYPQLEEDFPRIAVSLGGARKRLIGLNGKAKVTAGDVRGKPELAGYYSR